MKYSLGELCDFYNGGAWSDKEYVSFGLPVLKVTNCKPEGFATDDISYLPFSSAEKYAKNKLQKGDIVIATVGSHPNLVDSAAGRSCIINSIVEGYYLNQNAVCMRTKDSDILDQGYLGYHAKHRLFQHYIQMRGKGAANQMRIAIAAIKSYEYDFPSIKTQRKISEILSAYDSLIENNQKQIKFLEEAAQRLYKEWFVDLRFPGYETTPVVEGIPEGWNIKSILDNDIFIFVKSKVESFDGEKKYYATADVTGTTLTADGETINYMNRPSRAAVQPIVNSVWFARMSNSYKILNCFGASAHLANDSIISSGFAGFTAADGCYGFVYETIASKGFDEEKNRYATGATQVSLTNEGLKKIEVLIPMEEIIMQYSSIVEPFMQKAELLKKNNKLLKQARDRLLPKLMSGEIEV